MVSMYTLLLILPFSQGEFCHRYQYAKTAQSIACRFGISPDPQHNTGKWLFRMHADRLCRVDPQYAVRGAWYTATSNSRELPNWGKAILKLQRVPMSDPAPNAYPAEAGLDLEDTLDSGKKAGEAAHEQAAATEPENRRASSTSGDGPAKGGAAALAEPTDEGGAAALTEPTELSRAPQASRGQAVAAMTTQLSAEDGERGSHNVCRD